MYTNTDFENAIQLIEHYPLATIFTKSDSKVHHTQLPLVYDTINHRLIGHAAKSNAFLNQFDDECEFTLLFHGPNGYISPTFSSSISVPTWNYATVSIEAKLTRFDDFDEKMQLLDQQIEKYEPTWRRTRLSSEENQHLSHYIVGISFDISQWQSKFKMSQNKDLSTQEEIISKLNTYGNNSLAAFMKNLIHK